MAERKSNVELAREFFARWETSYDEMCQSYRDIMARDCLWENVGFSSTHGAEEAVTQGLDPVREHGMETIKVDNFHFGEADGVVWSERVDHVIRGDGSVGFSVGVVGVMEFNDEGQIVVWKEYFDNKHIIAFMQETEWLPGDAGAS